MKRRILWLTVSSLALLAVMAFIGSVKFHAQEKRKDENPPPIDVKGDEKESLSWADQIDPETLAIMRRQEALQPAVNALYEAYMKSPDSGFTSVAFEGDGLALYWKGPLNNVMLAAINEARGVGAVEIIPAPFSLAEMEAEAGKIAEAIKGPGGSDIQAITTRYDGSGLDIERIPFRAAENIALARARNGQGSLRSVEQVLAGLDLRIPVRVTTADEPIELMADRFNDTSPWNSGGYWESRRNGQARMACTTGFGIRAYNRTWVLTAAHCASAPDVAFHGFAGQYMGPVTREHYTRDLILIDAPGYHRMFDGPRYNDGYYKNVYGWGYHAVGELVCQSGATSGVVCDLRTEGSTIVPIKWPSDHPDSDGDYGYLVWGLIKTTHTKGQTAVRGGDSGGPVFTLMGNGVRAKGITSAGSDTTMYFQDWADVIRLYDGYPVTF